MSEKDTALAVPEKTQIIRNVEIPQSSKQTRLAAFTPVNLTEALALAKLMANSEVVPKEFKGKPASILIAMQMGAEVGLAPMQALQSVAVINGRPSLWGDAMLGLVQAHPDYEWHKEYFEGQDDGFTAVFVIKRKGQEPATTRFSVHDARVAKLWGKRGYNGQDTPWITNPKRMLQLRARGFGLRDRFADALKGLKLAEESMDLPPEAIKGPATAEIPVNVGAITESSEPNRGHGAEGMQIPQPPPPPSPKMDVDQTPKKQEDWICNECGEKNCHKKDCSHCALWLESLKKGGASASQGGQERSQASGTTPSTPSTPETSQKAFKRIACKVVSVLTRSKKPLRMLNVLTDEGEWQMSVWHEHLHPILDEKATGQFCMFEVSEKQKGDRTYVNLEHILDIGGQKYADDKPVEVQEGELSAQQLGFPKTDVDEPEIPE
jgi:hypothetical protein